MLGTRSLVRMSAAHQPPHPTGIDAVQPAPPDRVLVARLRAGDRDALGSLYDRYVSIALGVAYRVVNDRQVAEDVVHDAFVAAWQQVDRFDERRGTLRSWLLTIVRNRAIDRVRAARRLAGPDEQAAMEERTTGGNPTWDEAVARLSRDQVRSAMAQLPPDQLHAVELAYFGGLTYREIARVTRVPEGTASSRLRLALGKLRDVLRGTDAAPATSEADR
jgi:RNA polymerase sigma-70 factor (ECF subfamily)